jgi:hypothetical protein
LGIQEDARSPRATLAEYWRLAGSEQITEAEALELLALDIPEVTVSLAMNGVVTPAVLRAIFDLGGAPADAVLTNRNSPPELKALAPIGAHSDESLWRFAKDLDASEAQMQALFEELDRSPRPGGPRLADVWHEVVSKHPRP